MLPGQIKKTESLEERLQRNYSKLLRHSHFKWMCGVLLLGKYKVSDEFPTAYTDGFNCTYGREFCSKLTDSQLRFVILHENEHKMRRHLFVWKHLFKQNAPVANQALDHVINLSIEEYAKRIKEETGEDFITFPPKSVIELCMDPKYRGWDEGRIFYDLIANAKNAPKGGSKGKGGGSGSGGEKSFDQHGWEEAKQTTEAEQRDMQRQIEEAIRQGDVLASKTGSPMHPDSVGELLTPKIDYRKIMQEFIRQSCTAREYGSWARPSRRYMASGVYMPHTMGEQMGDVIVTIDRSGSVMQEITRFLSEVVGFIKQMKPSGVRIIYWDTAVTADEWYDLHQLDNIRALTKPYGGGGTDIEPVARYISEKKYTPQCILHFTDGYLGGSVGNWHHPLLWCVVDNNGFTPRVGKVVHIDSNDF